VSGLRLTNIGANKYSPLILAVVIIIAGTLLRITGLESAPPGLNQDEASAAYDAWAILHYGIDRNGDALPVLLTSWGSGQNALYSYLAMPSIGILVLTVYAARLPMAVLGGLAIAVAYLLGRAVKGERFGALLALTVALNPWHLTISRWALESNVLPFFILLAVYFMTAERPELAAASLALSLYAYGTAFVFVPLFVILVVITELLRHTGGGATYFTTRRIATAAAVFAVIALPITLCNVRNVLGMDEMRLLWFTLPKLTETRQSATMNLDIWQNLKNLAKLLWTQSDGLPWNSVPRFGLIYGKAGLLVTAFGVAATLLNLRKRFGVERFPVAALLAALTGALFIDANVNRLNMLLVPLIYFQAEGLWAIFVKIKRGAYVLVPAMLIAAVMMCVTYFTDYTESVRSSFESRDNMPYIYVLFSEQVPPYEFSSSVVYYNPGGAFQWVDYFEWRDAGGALHTYVR
jgi:hypothetical protein